MTPRRLRSVPETLHRYSKPARCLPIRRTKGIVGRNGDWQEAVCACAVATLRVHGGWREQRRREKEQKSLQLAN